MYKKHTRPGPPVDPVYLRGTCSVATSELYTFFNYPARVNRGSSLSSFWRDIAPLKYILILVSSVARTPLMKNGLFESWETTS